MDDEIELGSLAGLTTDAKSVAAAFFPTEKSHVTFHMEVSGPSERSQRALDELVLGGFVSKTIHNPKTGAATYRPLTDFGVLASWQMMRLLNGELEGKSFNLWEKLPEAQPNER